MSLLSSQGPLGHHWWYTFHVEPALRGDAHRGSEQRREGPASEELPQHLPPHRERVWLRRSLSRNYSSHGTLCIPNSLPHHHPTHTSTLWILKFSGKVCDENFYVFLYQSSKVKVRVYLSISYCIRSLERQSSSVPINHRLLDLLLPFLGLVLFLSSLIRCDETIAR